MEPTPVPGLRPERVAIPAALTLFAPTGHEIHGQKVVPGHPQLAVDQGGASRSAPTPGISTTFVDTGDQQASLAPTINIDSRVDTSRQAAKRQPHETRWEV
jgi:hypothetical protein